MVIRSSMFRGLVHGILRVFLPLSEPERGQCPAKRAAVAYGDSRREALEAGPGGEVKTALNPRFILCLFFVFLALIPTPTTAHDDPLANAAYLGDGLYLTSLRDVVAETDFLRDDGEVPLYAQLWTYDADGVDDYSESILSEYVCPGENEFVLIDELAPECVPYDRTGGDITLLYADRRFDLALLQADPPPAAEPLIIDAGPLAEGALLHTPSEDLTLESGRVINIDALTGEIIKTPADNEPFLSARALVADRESEDLLIPGTPVTDSEGELRGFVIRSAGARGFISPAAEWIDDLYAANAQIQSPALTAALARAILPDQIDGAPSIGDSFAPELGNTGIDVLHYDLTLFADPTIPAIDGTAVLTIATTYPNLASFTLDLHQIMTVSEVRVDGTPVEFEHSARKLRIFLPEPLEFAAQIDVAIDYGGELQSVPTPYLPFFSIGLVADPESPRFAMVTEPDTAHTWFPGNDHPLDTATYAFHITVDEPFAAVANGIPMETDGVFHWSMPHPMTTYLATLAVADYQLIEDTAPNGIPLRHYIYNSHNLEVATEVFSGTGLAMQTLEEFFGPYPFDSYGHVLVPMRGAALETQTMSAMPFPIANTDERAVWDLVVHEMAHQWFGNRVRLGAWQDIWLNEGFATYAEWLADESRFGAERHIQLRSSAENFIARGSRTTPLAYPQPAEMFSTDSYEKGGWVLHMLREELGDDLFFAMIQEYARVFADQPVTTAAFFQFVERFAARDLTQFRQQWLEQPLIPDYALYWTTTETGAEIRLCSQRPDQHYEFDLPLQFSDDDGNSALETLTVDAQLMDASITLDFAPTDLEVDPFETVLDGIGAQQVSELPPCN